MVYELISKLSYFVQKKRKVSRNNVYAPYKENLKQLMKYCCIRGMHNNNEFLIGNK